MINILISADSRYEVDKNFLRQVAISALVQRKIRGKVEVSISIGGDRAMSQLNEKYLKREGTTDVLAFPQEETTPTRNFPQRNAATGFAKYPDKILRLGDIVISYPQALAKAAEAGMPIEEELSILVEHGIDHLLGIHHE